MQEIVSSWTKQLMFRDGMFPANHLWGLWSGLQGVGRQRPRGARQGTLPGRARSLSHMGRPWRVRWHGPVAGLPAPHGMLRQELPTPHQGPAPNHPCSWRCCLPRAERASLRIWFNIRNLIPSLPENKLFSASVGSKWRRKSWAGRNDYVET